jgi:hypothetical protein
MCILDAEAVEQKRSKALKAAEHEVEEKSGPPTPSSLHDEAEGDDENEDDNAVSVASNLKSKKTKRKPLTNKGKKRPLSKQAGSSTAPEACLENDDIKKDCIIM